MGGKIAFGQEAPRLLAEIADAPGDGAAIEVVTDGLDGRPATLAGALPFRLRHALEGTRQVGLNKDLACLRRAATGIVDLSRGWPLFGQRPGAFEVTLHGRIQRETLGQLDGGLNDLAEAHRAVVLKSEQDGVYGARYNGAEGTERGDNACVRGPNRAVGNAARIIRLEVLIVLHGRQFRRNTVAV